MFERHKEAVKSYKNAIKINPDFPALHNNLGIAFKDLGQLEDAVDSYKKGLTFNPDYPDILNNLGVALFAAGRLHDAAKYLKKAVKVKPNYADAYLNLSGVLKHLELHSEAQKCLETLIKIDNNSVDAHNSLGNLYKDLAHLNKDIELLNEAVLSFKRALKINADFAEVHNNLGNVFKAQKQFDKSIKCFESAIALKPDFAAAHNNYGAVLAEDVFQYKDAIKSFNKAIVIEADFVLAHFNLGHTFLKLEQHEDSINSYQKVLDIKPDLDYILGNLLSTKMECCNWDNFSNLLKSAEKKINNNEKTIDPFNLMAWIDDPALQRKAAETKVSSNHPKNHTLPSIGKYPKHPKIRIGYFSGDFREHPLAYLTAELYEVHNREHFEIHAFSFGADTNDEVNLRNKAGVDHFHNVDQMSHKEIALLARSLEIDIAVDLSGITADARTEVFAMSAAPIQLSYIGFLGTMGADYYDYLIADPVMIPQENQKHYVEKIVYLPSFQVNDSKDLPPEITLTRKDVGLPEEGFVFCCFNNTYKFTPTIFDSWARILNQVDDSVLIVYANNELSKTNLAKEIVKRGVSVERLIFGDSLPKPKYLARYRTADLFLDTHPYNAGTTASDALKMGVPMVTYLGQSYQARMGASIVNALNLPELITNSLEEYESLAIELATNPDKLKAIKDKLASNLTTAPLFDTKRFTKNLESAYTKMYERSQKGLEPDHIYVEE